MMEPTFVDAPRYADPCSISISQTSASLCVNERSVARRTQENWNIGENWIERNRPSLHFSLPPYFVSDNLDLEFRILNISIRRGQFNLGIVLRYGSLKSVKKKDRVGELKDERMK